MYHAETRCIRKAEVACSDVTMGPLVHRQSERDILAAAYPAAANERTGGDTAANTLLLSTETRKLERMRVQFFDDVLAVKFVVVSCGNVRRPRRPRTVKKRRHKLSKQKKTQEKGWRNIHGHAREKKAQQEQCRTYARALLAMKIV